MNIVLIYQKAFLKRHILDVFEYLKNGHEKQIQIIGNNKKARQLFDYRLLSNN
jgi:hypothetical protein